MRIDFVVGEKNLFDFERVTFQSLKVDLLKFMLSSEQIRVGFCIFGSGLLTSLRKFTMRANVFFFLLEFAITLFKE